MVIEDMEDALALMLLSYALSEKSADMTQDESRISLAVGWELSLSTNGAEVQSGFGQDVEPWTLVKM